MEAQERRAEELASWRRFKHWAADQSVQLAFAEYRRLAEAGNWYALQWELEIANAHKPGISRPSIWDGDSDIPVNERGGGKSMPYSGLHRE